MGKWLVVDTADVKLGERCPIIHETTSEDRASEWIGVHGDPDKRERGLYHIDEHPMKGKEHAAWIETVASELGISLQWEFVPWSQSRNKGDEYPSLNYRVTLTRREGTTGPDRPFLTTDYMMGAGHCPSHNMSMAFGRVNAEDKRRHDARVLAECETGFAHGKFLPSYDKPMRTGRLQIKPKFADVLHSLVIDSGVLDYGSFEEWAPDVGYDPDSRKGEAVYRTCLEIALKLRSAMGDSGLERLREACEDY